MKDAIASSAVVCLLTLMLRAQRGRGGRRFQEQREISTPRSKLPVESNTFEIERKFPNDTLKLSQPLGMAVAQVFYEILEQNGDHSEGSLSAESLSKLLESALKESLMPVLGNDRFQFVEKFRDSFSSTYRTRATVRSTYEKAGMRETEARPYWGTHWRGSQPKSRRESHKHQYSDNVERHAKGREVNKRSIKPGAAGQTKACAVNDEEQVSVSRFKQGNSFFFSTSNHEQGGRSDCGESSTGRFLDENFLSVTSQLESCSQENYKFPVGEECSQDEQMYSADDSSEHEDWIVLERRASTSQAVLDDGLSSYHSLECDESLKDQDFNTRELVNTQKNPEPSSCSGGVVGCSMDSDWRGESSSCQGIATPRSGFCDETLDHGNYLDFPRSSRLNHDMDISFRGCLTDSLQQLGKPQVPRLIRSEDSRRGRGEGAFKRPPVSGDVSDRMMRPQARRGVTESSGLSVQDALVVARSPNVVGFKAAGEDRNDLLERSVAAQEQHNQLLAWDLHCRSQGLVMKQEHLHLQYESNTLLKENVELSRVKAEFKENELQDRKLSLAYSEFSRTCADQLVAGLCVMLVVLGFSFWKFSYERLAGVVTVCNPPNRETHQSGWLGTNWMYNSLNAFTFQIQALTCEITKAGRMVVGLIIIAFVTSSLLRRSVTSSSQAMPATIIVIVLGGICGFAGKISVDSLGGSGLHWLVLWECLCFLHAFATCFPPLLYHLLNGPPQRNYFEKPSTAYRISSGISRFVFHTILVFILPFMAGVLPFASPEEIMQIFLDWSSPVTFHGKYRVHV